MFAPVRTPADTAGPGPPDERTPRELSPQEAIRVARVPWARRWLVPERSGPEETLLPPGPPRRAEWGWYVLLVLYAAAAFPLWLDGRFSPLVVQNDARMQVAPYWRFHAARPQEADFTGDYYYAYTTPGHRLVYYLLTFLVTPPVASHVVTVGLLAGTCWYFVRFGRAARLPAVGAVMGIFILKGLAGQSLAGGLPRSFAPLVAAAFLYHFLTGGELGVLAALAAGAAFYPPVLAVCLAAYGLWLLGGLIRRGRGRFLRRCLRLGCAAGLYGLLMSPNLLPPDGAGEVLTEKQALAMPECRKGGRLKWVPFKPPLKAIVLSASDSFKSVGARLSPQPGALAGFLRRTAWLFLPAACGLLMLRRPVVRLLPRLVCFAAGAVLMFAAARLAAFRLYVPDRMLLYALPFLIALVCCLGLGGLPAVPWRGRRVDLRRVLPAVFLLSAMLVYGPGVPRGLPDLGYIDARPNAPLYEFLARLPGAARLAGDPVELDNAALISARTAYITFETAQPLHLGFYAEARRRLHALHRGYFATRTEDLADFLRSERIDYLLINRRHFGPGGLDRYDLFEPFTTELRQRLKGIPPEQFVLARADSPGIVFEHGPFAVLDAARFLTAQGAAGRSAARE